MPAVCDLIGPFFVWKRQSGSGFKPASKTKYEPHLNALAGWSGERDVADLSTKVIEFEFLPLARVVRRAARPRAGPEHAAAVAQRAGVVLRLLRPPRPRSAQPDAGHRQTVVRGADERLAKPGGRSRDGNGADDAARGHRLRSRPARWSAGRGDRGHTDRARRSRRRVPARVRNENRLVSSQRRPVSRAGLKTRTVARVSGGGGFPRRPPPPRIDTVWWSCAQSYIWRIVKRVAGRASVRLHGRDSSGRPVAIDGSARARAG